MGDFGLINGLLPEAPSPFHLHLFYMRFSRAPKYRLLHIPIKQRTIAILARSSLLAKRVGANARIEISISYRRKDWQRGHYNSAFGRRARPGQMGPTHRAWLAIRPLHWLFWNHTVFLFRLATAVCYRGSRYGRRGTVGSSASSDTGSIG